MKARALIPFLGLAFLPRPAACALPVPSGGAEEPRPTLFLREEGDLTHALALAEGYEKAGAWEEAAEQAQKVLDADADVLAPVGPDGAIAPQGAERYCGARARILDRLALWPPAGRQALAALSEAPAQALWQHAGNDAVALGRIAGRFPFSSIADRAMSRLADIRMEAGEPAAAVGILEMLQALHPDSPFCGAFLQERRKAALALLESGPRSPVAGVPWTVGSGTRASARPGLPLWTFLVDPDAEAARAEYLRRGLEQPQPYLPLCVGDLVLLGTSRGLNALERTTGRLRWTSGEPGGNALVPGPCAPAVADGHCLLLMDGRLAAYELAGGRKAWETPAGLRAVTPPALRGGVAYVGFLESSGPKVTFTACALRVRDGRVLWRRHVTTSFDRAPLGEGPRGAVAVGETLAVFSTDMGCVMALDLLSGDPRWLVRYDAFRESDRRLAARAGQRWDPNPVLLAEDRVLVAPRDAAWLLCLGEKDGDLCWREARQGATALLGAGSGSVFLSGPSGARAVSLTDARPAWAALLPVSGRGWLGDGTLTLPGPEGPAVLEASSGRVLHRDRWPDGAPQGGNLVPSGDLVLFASASRLTACEEASASRARLKDGADLARLLLQQDDPEGALELLPPGAGALRAEALARKAAGAESRADWAAAAEAREGAAICAPETTRRLLHAFEAGGDWQRAGRPDRAVASFQRMLREEGSLPWRYGEIRSGWAARLAIEEVLRASGRGPYAPFEKEAEGMLGALVPGAEEAALQEILARYPNSLAAPRAALALGRLYLSRHVTDPARRCLLQARQEGDAATSRAAGELLASLACPSPVPRLAWRMRRGQGVSPPEPRLPLLVQDAGGISALEATTGALLWHRPASGRSLPPLWSAGIAVLPEDRNLLGLDSRDGHPVWTAALPSRPLRLWGADGTVLAESAEELLLFDAATGKLRGRTDLGAPLATAPVLLPSGRALLAVTSPSGRLPARAHWLDAGDARVLASASLGLEGVGEVATCPDAGVVLALMGSRRVVALPLEPAPADRSPTPLWEHAEADGPVLGGLLAGSGASVAVLLPLPGGGATPLQALDLLTGKLAWKAPRAGIQLRGACLSGGSLLSFAGGPGRAGAMAWDLKTGRQSWRSDLWSRQLQGDCLPLTSGLLVWAEGEDDPVLLDPGTGRTLHRFEGLADPPVGVLRLQDGFVWIGERFLSACLQAEELDLLRDLWRFRDIPPAGAPPAEALALADALFRNGSLAEALEALARVGRSGDPALLGEFEARAPSWREVRQVRSPEILLARRFRARPEIDGELRDGWAEHLRHRLEGPMALRRFDEGAPWEGDPDLAAELYVGWDDENLYFAVDVDDQKQVIFDEEDPDWRGDLLLFALDNGADRLFDGGMAIQNPRARPPDPATLPPGDYAARRRADDTGTVYEGAIPWQALRKGGSGEATLRINLLIGDDDGEGLRKALLAEPGFPTQRFQGRRDAERLDPRMFLKLKLID